MTATALRRWRITLVVVLALVTVYAVYRYTLHWMIEAKLEEFRRQGQPVSFIELDKQYPPPRIEDNAALIYTQAFAQFSSAQKSSRSSTASTDTNLPIIGWAKLPINAEPLPEVMKAAVTNYLAQNTNALRLLHQAATKEICQYDLGLNEWGKKATLIYGPIRQGARLLVLEAIWRAESGQSEAAVQSLLATGRLAKSLEIPPLLLSHLVRQACEGLCELALQRALTVCRFDDAQLELVLHMLMEEEHIEPAVQFAVGDLCFQRGMFVALRTARIEWGKPSFGMKMVNDMTFGEDAPPNYGWRLFCYRISGRLDRDELAYLRFMDTYLKLCRLPLTERLRAMKLLEGQYQDFPRCYAFTRQVLFGWDKRPSFGTPTRLEAKRIARIRCSATACAVERFRLANNSLPNSVSALVPQFLAAVPIDPFDGQPLRYKKLVKGYVVYSVGEDGTDDGGDEKKDITFVVER